MAIVSRNDSFGELFDDLFKGFLSVRWDLKPRNPCAA